MFTVCILDNNINNKGLNELTFSILYVYECFLLVFVGIRFII